MRTAPYFRYVLPSVLLHSLILNTVDAFSLVKASEILFASLADTAVTVALIMIIEFVGRKK